MKNDTRLTVKEYNSLKYVEDVYYEIFTDSSLHVEQCFDITKILTGLIYNIKANTSKFVFAVVFDESKPVALFPLRVFGDTYEILGGMESLEYVDMISTAKSVEEAERIWIALLHFLHQSRRGSELKWSHMPTDNVAYKALHELNKKGIVYFNSTTENCVKIMLDDVSYETYFKGLNKHVRQNCRTAYNRLTTDNMAYEFHFYYGDTLKKARHNKYIYDSVYLQRRKTRYGNKLHQIIFRKYFAYVPKTVYKKSGFVADFTINGQVAAMMQGYYTEKLQSLDVKRVAINERFKKYSPGICMINEAVKYLLQNTNITTIDLCRGDEKYKLDMGGVVYNTCNLTIPITNMHK